jgi:hypothetical protein
MTSTVADHYEGHLGPIYTWMVGDVEAALSRSDLVREGLRPLDGGRRFREHGVVGASPDKLTSGRGQRCNAWPVKLLRKYQRSG